MAATSDLVPNYLREAWNRAIGNPTSDNAALQRFVSPLDEVLLAETVAASVNVSPHARYGTGAALTLSGNEITDALRALSLSGDGAAIPGGIGVWEGTTNLCTNGGFETGITGWTGRGATPAVITLTSAWAKFGTHSCQIVCDGSVADQGLSATAPFAVAGAGATETFSAWAQGSGTIQIVVNWYTGADVFISTSVGPAVVLSATPQRIVFSVASPPTAAKAAFNIGTPLAQAVTFYVDGLQVEDRPFATPYVETNGATASRGKAHVQAPASLLNATQGAVVLRAVKGPSETRSDGQPVRLAGQNGYGSNWAAIFHEGGYIKLSMYDTARNTDANILNTWVEGDTDTVIGAWDANYLYISLNGSAWTKVARTQFPAFTGWYIGSDALVSWNGRVLYAATFTGDPTLLDPAAIQAIFTAGGQPTQSDYAAGAGMTAILPMTVPIYQTPTPHSLYGVAHYAAA